MRWARTPATREVLLAAGLTVAVELELALSDRMTVGRGAAGLLVTLPLAFRLRCPLAVLVLVVAGVVIEAALGGNPATGPVFPVIAVVLALYAVGSRRPGRGHAARARAPARGRAHGPRGCRRNAPVDRSLAHRRRWRRRAKSVSPARRATDQRDARCRARGSAQGGGRPRRHLARG